VSYVRWGPTSDVYVFDVTDGGTACCACDLNEGMTLMVDTHAEMIHHLRRHLAAGQKVPEDVIPALAETE